MVEWFYNTFGRFNMATEKQTEDKLSFPRLIRFNKIMGTVHLIQGTLMMLFAFLVYPNLDGTGTRTFTIPVVGNFLEFVQGEGLAGSVSTALTPLANLAGYQGAYAKYMQPGFWRNHVEQPSV